MSYTVGIKRRFLPGYRKVQVTAHDWKDFRFILNLSDGSQESIPGFQLTCLKVYADFWTHLAQIEQSKANTIVPRETPTMAEEIVEIDGSEPVQEPLGQESPIIQEAKRRATERVRNILASDGAH